MTSVTGSTIESSTTTIAPERVEILPPKEQYKGQNVPRKEDKRLVQGQGVFVDDIKRHHMGYIHFVRSPYAHAHITSLDVSKVFRNVPVMAFGWPFAAVGGRRQRPQNQPTVLRL